MPKCIDNLIIGACLNKARKICGASPISVQILSYFWSFRNIELVVIFPEQVTQKILIAFGARLK
ncbi:MAG: hypothetical protein AB1393_12700, partial [Candidatus Edwardsbacteria bacterium]